MHAHRVHAHRFCHACEWSAAHPGQTPTCVLCEQSGAKPDGGPWDAFPMMRCRPPWLAPGAADLPLVHIACATSFAPVYMPPPAARGPAEGAAAAGAPPVWVWDAEGERTIEQLRHHAKKHPCVLCGTPGACVVQCADGEGRRNARGKLTGCTKSLHPTCAQQQGLLRTKGDAIGSFCSAAHLPRPVFDDDDDDELAAAAKRARHQALATLAGADAEHLGALRQSLHDPRRAYASAHHPLPLPIIPWPHPSYPLLQARCSRASTTRSSSVSRWASCTRTARQRPPPRRRRRRRRSFTCWRRPGGCA